jgi:Domain of unknown function (DUF4169)
MSGDIVNLNRVRKSRARDDRTKQAAENRVKFGRTKAEKQVVAANEILAAQRLDGAQRVPGDTPSQDPDAGRKP